MPKENNKMQVDIENLIKQNVNDLTSIKELYRKLEEIEKKITQIKYIDSNLANKLKKEYEKLKKIILDENVQAKLSNDIEEINSQLDTKANNDELFFYSPFQNDLQGDCFIFNNKDKTIMIDTGTSNASSTIINYIKAKGITKIDYMIITHYHSDHCQGFENLVNGLDFSTCEVLLPPQIDWNNFIGDTTDLQYNENEVKRVINEKGLKYRYLINSDTLIVNSVILKFLNCNTQNYSNYYNITIDSNGIVKKNETNYNNFSIGIFIEHYKNKLFIPSDMDIKAQDLVKNELINVDFMCLPHHGCNEQSNISFLRKLSPSDVLASGIGQKRESSTDLIYMFDVATCYHNKKGFELVSSVNSIKVNVGETIKPFSLYDNGNMISKNSDLNNFKYVGSYYSPTGDVSATIKNTPITESGFRLNVKNIIGSGSVLQEIISNDKKLVIYSRYYHLVNEEYGEWIELTRNTFNNRMIISTSDTLVQCINRISDYNFKVLNISTGTALYEQLSKKITDSHGLYLKIEKLNGNYAILTLTGKSIEKMFIGHCVSGNVTWKEVTLV